MSKRLSLSLVSCSVTALLALAAVPVSAQNYRPERPYRGLFAAGTGDQQQGLIATATVAAGWDDNLVADVVGENSLSTSDFTRQFRGGLGTASGGLSYTLTTPRFGIGASAATSGRYYRSLVPHSWRRDYLSAGATTRVTPDLSAYVGVTYLPYSFLSLFPTLSGLGPGEVAVNAADFPASIEHILMYSGGASFARPLSRRGRFDLNYGYSARGSAPLLGRFQGHITRTGYSYDIGRGLSLRLGYGYTKARYEDDNNLWRDYHLIDAGIDYSHALSFSRNTSVSFGTGTVAVKHPGRALVVRYHARAIGNARIDHEFGRTWNLSLAYARGVQLVESWPEPLFTDSLTAGLNGLFTRRLDFSLVARALRGSRYFDTAQGRLESYHGSVQLRYALSQYASTGIVYWYYRHDLGARLLLPPAFPNGFERQNVSAFVSLWAPLFQQARRP